MVCSTWNTQSRPSIHSVDLAKASGDHAASNPLGGPHDDDDDDDDDDADDDGHGHDGCGHRLARQILSISKLTKILSN